ncbi:MAG: hypothetical protein HXX20_13420 [Chloroflexi bacterium]|nr:hypothetical protein [Chloroflexota bacterium]
MVTTNFENLRLAKQKSPKKAAWLSFGALSLTGVISVASFFYVGHEVAEKLAANAYDSPTADVVEVPTEQDVTAILGSIKIGWPTPVSSSVTTATEPVIAAEPTATAVTEAKPAVEVKPTEVPTQASGQVAPAPVVVVPVPAKPAVPAPAKPAVPAPAAPVAPAAPAPTVAPKPVATAVPKPAPTAVPKPVVVAPKPVAPAPKPAPKPKTKSS